MPFRAFSRVIFWLVIAVSALSPEQAIAGVKQAPQVKGSLERSGRECDRDRQIGLRIAICFYAFRADPALDGDPDHLYTARWTQISIQPLSGHCAGGARGSFRIPDASIISWAPSRRSSPGRNTVQLRLATPDQALGSLEQRFMLARGVTFTELRRSPHGDRLRWRWRGRSREDLIRIVVGAGFAGPITDDPFAITEEVTDFTSTEC